MKAIPTKRVVPVLIVALLPVAFATGYAVRGSSRATAPALTPATVAPGDRSVEAGFARDMSVHHSQAVDMAERIRTRTSDKTIRILATDIVLTQQNQIGQFRGWLEQWNLRTASNDLPMSWMADTDPTSAETDIAVTSDAAPTTEHQMTGMDAMNESNPTATMPGMASRTDVNALTTLPVDDAERSFLKLMISHHIGGVAMAEAVLTRTQRPEVLRIAKSIVASQTGEITAMRQLLASRTTSPS